MKREIHKKTETELLEQYPIRSSTPDWFFRTKETSNNCWEIEGIDCWGRKFHSQGDDPDVLIKEAEIEVRRISNEGNAT
jgi:hypothetical protein